MNIIKVVLLILGALGFGFLTSLLYLKPERKKKEIPPGPEPIPELRSYSDSDVEAALKDLSKEELAEDLTKKLKERMK